MPKDVDALAVWDAKARTLIGRIDAALADTPVPADTPTSPAAPTAEVDADPPLVALVHRVVSRTPPPPGEILTPTLTLTPTNMGPQPDRIDPWDAYVCRFDNDGEAEPLRRTP